MRRPGVLLMFLGLLAVIVFFTMPLLGMRWFPVSTYWHPRDETTAMIFWQLRFPRLLVAMAAGSGLAMAGMIFQAIFRNPLATPFTLGVASGASLGASIYFLAGGTFLFFGLPGVTWAALAGALLAMGIVHLLARSGETSSQRMLLAGVAVSFFFSSLILFVQYISDLSRSYRMIRWVMGGLQNADAGDLRAMAPFVVAGLLVMLWFSRELDLLTTGETRAEAAGVDIARLRTLLFFTASIVTASVVAVCGPVGFVGLMVPHMCRLVLGPSHRYLVPACFLAGAAFLGICDTLARSLLAPAELPVGILTSLMGGPFFLWLLLRRQDGI